MDTQQAPPDPRQQRLHLPDPRQQELDLWDECNMTAAAYAAAVADRPPHTREAGQ